MVVRDIPKRCWCSCSHLIVSVEGMANQRGSGVLGTGKGSRGSMVFQLDENNSSKQQRNLNINAKALYQFMQRNNSSLSSFRDDGTPLRIAKFSNGQSNPTYLVSQGETCWVLRRKPPGYLLPSAHAVEREYAFQKALKDARTNLPVPQVFVLCEDPGVIGSSFYMMEHLDGVIYKNPKLPGQPGAKRRKLFMECAKQLAILHSIDAGKLNIPTILNNARKPNSSTSSYGLRTLRRWKKQYLASCTAVREEPLRNMIFLSEFLEQHAPKRFQDKKLCILHGDFRMDNIIFRAETDEVMGVLDWELATVGTRDQALADVAYACLPYYLPPTVKAIQTLTRFSDGDSGDLALDLPPGTPTLQEFLDVYCKSLNQFSGYKVISSPAAELVESHEWRWFVCLALFRVAGILAGVGSRAKAGNASALDASVVGSRKVVSQIIDTAIELIKAELMTEDDRKMRCEFLVHKARIFIQNHMPKAERVLLEHASTERKWEPHPLVEKLKTVAKDTGLWNCFLSQDLVQQARSKLEQGGIQLSNREWTKLLGPGLSNREYMDIAELMGLYPWSSEIFNCSAPDTGNMEVLIRYGTPDQCVQWVLPLLRGEIRSCFAMTEPKVASSDATNISCPVRREGKVVTCQGLKWWITGAMHPKCDVCLFLGKDTEAKGRHDSHTLVLLPMNTNGLKVVRPLDVMGFEDPPFGHAEMSFDNVQVPIENIIHKPGKGFEVAQSRLGPGRLHHCARAIGIGERAIALALERAHARKVFGAPIAKHGGFLQKLAQVRMEIDQARLLVENGATMLDKSEESTKHGNPTRQRYVRMALAQAKVRAPLACLEAIDFAMQVHGATGMSSRLTILPHLWAHVRTLRVADGPDDVHLSTISKLEIKNFRSKL